MTFFYLIFLNLEDNFFPIIICNWCFNSGECSFTTEANGQKKKFCHETCFSKWRRYMFKYENICDNCKKGTKNINDPFVYHFKENDQHFQYCGYLCFLSFKESLSYNLIKTTGSNKIASSILVDNLLCRNNFQKSVCVQNNVRGLVKVDKLHKKLQNRIKMMSVLDLLTNCNYKNSAHEINMQQTNQRHTFQTLDFNQTENELFDY